MATQKFFSFGNWLLHSCSIEDINSQDLAWYAMPLIPSPSELPLSEN